jgi:hypothetical protein
MKKTKPQHNSILITTCMKALSIGLLLLSRLAGGPFIHVVIDGAAIVASILMFLNIWFLTMISSW